MFERIRNWIKELKYIVNKNVKFLFYFIFDVEKECNFKINCVRLE